MNNIQTLHCFDLSVYINEHFYSDIIIGYNNHCNNFTQLTLTNNDNNKTDMFIKRLNK